MTVQLNSLSANVDAPIPSADCDEWTPEQLVGDCKDFTMNKRQRLVGSGWPASVLPVAIVRKSSGDDHLVLVARTTQGDCILDALTDGIVPWTWTSSPWKKIQSTINALAWRAF